MRFVSRPETNLTDRVVDNNKKKCSIVVLGFQKYIYFQKIESIYIWLCVRAEITSIPPGGGFHLGIVVLEAVYAS